MLYALFLLGNHALSVFTSDIPFTKDTVSQSQWGWFSKGKKIIHFDYHHPIMCKKDIFLFLHVIGYFHNIH